MFHYCTLAYYGKAPVGVHLAWDGELLTEQAAQETVDMLEQKRQTQPDWKVETPYGFCKPVSAYLQFGRIVWKLESL